MKKFLTFSACILFFSMSLTLFGQSATGSCNSLTVSQIPNYPNNLYHIQGVSGGGECFRYTHHNNTIGAKYRLQKFNEASQQFANEGNLQFGANITFNNLVKGRYRVLIDVPSIVINNSCRGNRIDVYNSLSQFVGIVGDYQSALLITNEVLVGSTQDEDISFEIGDADDFPSSAADPGELLLLDARESKHHTHYKLMVNRKANANGNNSAWWESSWKESSDLYTTILDLEDEYGFTFYGNFNYDVTLVLKNATCNQVWVADTQGLFICPTAMGCKENIEEAEPISFYPNPANTSIYLDNYTPNSRVTQTILVTDVMGRTLINQPLFESEISVADLSAGMYILNIIEEGQLLFTEKLVIKR